MRRTPTAANQRGFTLIEMLIIAPLVIVAVSGFIALMVAMVGDVLQTRDQNVLTYDAQDALDRIEQDAHLSTKFLSTSGTQTTPQGSDASFTGTAAFSSSSSIIFSEPATDQSSTSPTRNLIYYAYQPNACGFNETFNKIFTIQVVYFINNGSLWRRTIVPSYNTNATVDANTICNDFLSTSRPWAQNTCSPGYTAPRCETNDEEIMKNIDSFTTKYYNSPSGTTDIGVANAENATTIDVTINGKKTTAGRAFTTSSSLRVSRINNLDVDVLAPDKPTVTHSTASRPDKVTFSWNAVDNAASYGISYNINGGTWINATLSNSTLSYTVDANRGDTVSFKVTANGGAQNSTPATDAVTMDLWTPLDLQHSWTNYNSTTYDTAQFTKAPDGTVFLKGTIKGGAVTSGTVIANLPPGYRPSAKLVMAASTSSNVAGRVDIDDTGDVLVNVADNTYLSLDNIAFLPSTLPYTWNAPTFPGTWSSYANGYEDVHATKDNIGRVHVQGLARAGTTTAGTTITQLQSINSSYAPAKTYHFSAGGAAFSEFWIAPDGSLVKRGSQAPAYMGLQTIYYPGTLGTWTPLSLQHGWLNFGTPYSDLQYTKASDKIVTIRGVVKSGTTLADTVIATLPSGNCPITRQVFSVPSNDVYGRVDVDGCDIKLRSGSNTWLAINISFVVN